MGDGMIWLLWFMGGWVLGGLCLWGIMWLKAHPSKASVSNSKAPAAPHERWPEIMHWRKGDKFDFVHYHDSAYCPVLISIREDGFALCQELGHRVKLPLGRMIGKNLSLQDREIDETLKRSDGYMELIQQFNAAFNELQERDKRNGVVNA